MVDKNSTARVTPDEIVIKLVEKNTAIKDEKGQGQEALLMAKGNGKGKHKGRKCGKCNESDEVQRDRKGQPMCSN